MKKLILILLLVICVSQTSYSQFAIGTMGKTKWSDSTGGLNWWNTLKFRSGFYSFGTSFMNGSLSFGSGYGILMNAGNINLTNGGAYLLDGVSLKSIFGETNDSNKWKRWNGFDTLGIGNTARLTWNGSLISISEGIILPTIAVTDLDVSRSADFTGATITGMHFGQLNVDTISTFVVIKDTMFTQDIHPLLPTTYDIGKPAEEYYNVYAHNFIQGGVNIQSFFVWQTSMDSTPQFNRSVNNFTGSISVPLLDSAGSPYATQNWVFNNIAGSSIDTNNLLGAWRENNRAIIDSIGSGTGAIIPIGTLDLGNSDHPFSRIRADAFTEGGVNLEFKYLQIAQMYSKAVLDGRFLHSADSLKYFTTYNQDTATTPKLAMQNTFTNNNKFSGHVAMGTSGINPTPLLAVGIGIGDTSRVVLNAVGTGKNTVRTGYVQATDTASFAVLLTPFGQNPYVTMFNSLGVQTFGIDTAGGISGKSLTITNSITANNYSATSSGDGFKAAASGFFYWNGRAALSSTADGVVNLFFNNGTTYGTLNTGILVTKTVTAPASAGAAGVQGEVRFASDGYIYICIATNTWQRTLTTTF